MKVYDLGTIDRNCDKHGKYLSYGTKYNDTEVWGRCGKCVEAEEEKERLKEDEEKNRIVAKKQQKKLDDCGILKRYQGINLDTYEPKENQIKAFTVCNKIFSNFPKLKEKGQVVIFCGGVGTGKTMLVSALLQSMMEKYTCRYVRAIDISRDIRETYQDTQKSEKSVIRGFTAPELLIIDEVGLQQGTSNENMLLTDLFDRRCGDLKPTIICSNLNEGELEDNFGARAWSRIKQNCLICPIVGDDLRRVN